MIYYLGISRMNRQEKIALTAQLQSLTGLNVVGDAARKAAAKAKTGLLGGLAHLLDGRGKGEYAERVRETERKISWDTETLAHRLDEKLLSLGLLSDEQLIARLRECLCKLAEAEDAADDQGIATGILQRAARSMKIDPSFYVDQALLERVVFDAAVQRQCKALEERLQKLSPAESAKMAAILEEELNRLTQSEREAICQFTGTQQLSGQAVLSILRTLSGVAMAKLVFTGAGMGAFLFLTTAMKATSLLLGVTLSFGTYATATSALAFLASAPVMALVAGLSGGFILNKTNSSIEDQLSQLVVVSGHWRMSCKSTA